ncbi:hypothetical protein ACFUEM_38665 [Streptomyces anulatus]|uniref:hypothetical protein n=1 Tax=Streptomyces anulatus TaxID=1892 RepID=UPI0035D9A20B
MSASANSRPAAAHPVVLLARTVAAILGILAVAAHLPAVWVVLAALSGYAVILWAFRSAWPASAPAAKTG